MMNKNKTYLFLILLSILTIILIKCKKLDIEREAAVITSGVYDIKVKEVSAAGQIIDMGQGITQYGFAWSENSNPSIEDDTVQLPLADQIGYFTSIIKNLNPATRYNIRSYVITGENFFYGEVLTFSTNPQTAAVVSTIEVNNITPESVTVNGSIESMGDGIDTLISSGFCWSIDIMPTIEDNFIELGGRSQAGEFTGNIVNLSERQTYYIRAFVINEINISYGEEISFVTSGWLPLVVTDSIQVYSYEPMYVTGKIEDFGYGQDHIEQYGHCWSTSPGPDINDFNTELGTTDDSLSFLSLLNGLEQNTVYYLKAYATNAEGTSYGNEIVFKSFGLEMIFLEGDTFSMGSNEGFSDEEPVHSVFVNNFQISKYEVTNAQFCTFLNAIEANPDGSYNGTDYINISGENCFIKNINNRFYVSNGDENLPATNITWHGANEFCLWFGGRLPTEAEWEFAAKGGINSKNYIYSGGDNYDDVGWYDNNSGNVPNNIGLKLANESGIYDMSGNVWEWCKDWYKNDYYLSSPENNPQGPATGSSKVLRGGSYDTSKSHLRNANRGYLSPGIANSDNGFRVLREIE